jgi:hypothetical protein
MGSHNTIKITKDLYLYIGAWWWLLDESKHVGRVVRKYKKYRSVWPKKLLLLLLLYSGGSFGVCHSGVFITSKIIIIMIIIREAWGKIWKLYQETFDRFTTKDSYTWNSTHNKESTAVWSLKLERWGSPLVQEKYQEEKSCEKRHPYNNNNRFLSVKHTYIYCT